MNLIRNDEIIDKNCILAKTFLQKLTGKIFTDNTCFLTNCNSIHTIFMDKSIDVAFIDNNGVVVKIIENLPRRSIIFPVKKAKHVIEFNAGFVKSAKINLGDILNFKE